jgi:hypothetical protein
MMLFKKIILLLYILTLDKSLMSQLTIGLEVGTGKNLFNTNIDDLSYTTVRGDYGVMLGLPVIYEINNGIFLRSGIIYLQKNYSNIRTGPYSGVYTSFNNSYLMVPLTAGINWGKHKLKPFANTGIYGAWWMIGKTSGKIPDILSATTTYNENGQLIETLKLIDFSSEYIFNSHKDKRFEFGLACGIGCNYFINRNNSVDIEINYFHAFTDQQKKYMINQNARYNRTVCVSLGYQYHFSR